ncbi:MAG: zinc transporter ZntB [Sphingomonadaceae bacterium]|nr:zinc transporter ZntB [Sphingomonadaceae bacterium]
MIRVMDFVDGTVHAADAPDVSVLEQAPPGFRWLHFQQRESLSLLEERDCHLPEAVVRALLAVETRPRCDMMAEGVLLNLRAPLRQGDGEREGDPLASMRIWATPKLLISVAFRETDVLPATIAAFEAGRLHDCGDVLVALLSGSAEQLDAAVAQIGDALDLLEEGIDRHASFEQRRETSRLRSAAIGLRRFVAPQRQALESLMSLNLPWFDTAERAHMREATDRFYRMAEELESVRERAAVLHDEITDLRSERMDARSLQVAIAALIFLPLTFITGLLGMNVEGIPYAKAPWAFWGVTALCIAIAIVVGAWFIWRGWSKR